MRRSREPLPDRIQEAIRSREARSEVLIGWVQLCVVALFAVLYAITPRAADNLTMFQPVPLALAGYFAFTVLRLLLARARMTPPWLLYLSIVVDVGMLLGLIWSFHIQYHQPAPFYLKAPTVLYLFIFITLRALRFDARYVIVAGLVAAAGWAVMVGYAVAVSDQPITRDYVDYMTGNRILLGAEMDKIISILVVTVILALALIRGRALLVDAVRAGQAARDLSRFFDPAAARAITRADRQIAAGDGMLRQVAILMVDIRGFSVLAERLTGEAVMAILADYHRCVVPIVRGHGGAVDKFLGDGVMATFVAPGDGPAPAADALTALDGVLAALADWQPLPARGERLRVNAAVATGRVAMGAVGDAERLEYTVIGSAVNLAAKLEKYNKDAGSAGLTTADTYALALAQGYTRTGEVRRIAGAAVAGLGDPIDLVALAEAAG